MSIIFYYSAFLIIYAGKLEFVKFDRVENLVEWKEYNIFLAMRVKRFNLNEIEDIEVVLSGVKQGTRDTTKYYIRLTFADGKQLTFGECMSFRKGGRKVKN